MNKRIIIINHLSTRLYNQYEEIKINYQVMSVNVSFNKVTVDMDFKIYYSRCSSIFSWFSLV